MGVLAVILLCLAGLYASTLVWLHAGFRKACRDTGSNFPEVEFLHADPVNSVSVIIPARNEADNIAACLDSIFANDYPNFDVTVVDDASDDRTSELARLFSIERGLTEQLRIIHLDEPTQDNATAHKKRAITAGIAASRGDIIVTTDADSVVPNHWLRSLVGSFSEGVDLVSAPVAYREGGSVIEHAVAMEMLGLVAAGGGAISNGHPNMCNGANLAYRRSAFERVGGFDSIDQLASGDDVFLMLKMSSSAPDSVRFCADPDALVITQPASGWREFVRQRRRWASKGLHLGNTGVAAVALLVYGFHATLLTGAIAALFSPALWPAVAVAFVLKMASEGLLLYAACHQFERPYLLRSFVPAQILHTPYVVAVGFLGVFGGGFAWKGRELAR